MKRSVLYFIGLILTMIMLVSCGSPSTITTVQPTGSTDNISLTTESQSPLPRPTDNAQPTSASPEPTDLADVVLIPAYHDPALITEDEARTICIDWLDDHANSPSYTLLEWEDGLYPAYDILGEKYYSFFVRGMPVSWFRILVHIETGETLFVTMTNEDHPSTAIGRLDAWHNWEPTVYAPQFLTVDEAIAIYNTWLVSHSDFSSYTLDRQSYEQFELRGEPYYLLHAEEMSMYWYNILVHIETGELLFMMMEDGQFPVTSIALLDDWYDSIYGA